ncbi:MAG: hypothetical protein WC615_19045 [Mucilaginibacter sp.]|jgi:hypothetical protein|uniref:hypothetical protein n=1 Tax=Mucilaginibacter sp. TaxID=1882438 RepID=UPI003563EFEC
MARYLLLITLFFSSAAFAQAPFNGRVLELKTRIGLAGIRVENLNSKKATVTNNTGNFSIPAKNGDLLTFKGFAYSVDTLLVTEPWAKEIFLEPLNNELQPVNITTAETKNINTYYDPLYHGQPVVYARDKKGYLTGGIIWRIWYWKKDAKKKAKLEEKQRKYDIMYNISLVFTPKTIGNYVPLTGPELDNFITLYTPTPAVYSANDFNLVNYLNDCYKKYQELPTEKRVPTKLKE